METAFIGLGANLGDRTQTLTSALQALSDDPDIVVAAASGPFHSDPVGGPAGQQAFVNAAARLQTSCGVDEGLLTRRTAYRIGMKRSGGGGDDDVGVIGQGLQSRCQRLSPIAEVRPQADEGRFHHREGIRSISISRPAKSAATGGLGLRIRTTTD